MTLVNNPSDRYHKPEKWLAENMIMLYVNEDVGIATTLKVAILGKIDWKLEEPLPEGCKGSLVIPSRSTLSTTCFPGFHPI